MTPNSDFQFMYKESGNSMTTAKLQSARLLPHWRPSSKYFIIFLILVQTRLCRNLTIIFVKKILLITEPKWWRPLLSVLHIIYLTLYDPGGGRGFKSPPPLRFFALTYLILELHYCALVTFPKKIV